MPSQRKQFASILDDTDRWDCACSLRMFECINEESVKTLFSAFIHGLLSLVGNVVDNS